MPQGEVLGALPPGGIAEDPRGIAPPITHGYRVDRYFVEGFPVEVVWAHDPELGYPAGDFRSTLTPVLFRNAIFDGWGWTHFDSRAADWGLVAPVEVEEVGPTEEEGGSTEEIPSASNNTAD